VEPVADLPRIGATPGPIGVDLLWIPLGAGAHVVRVSGKVFEACSALVQRRPPCALYHSALEVTLPAGRYVVEPVREEAPVLTPEEGIEVSLNSYRQGRVVDAKRVREIIDAAIGR